MGCALLHFECKHPNCYNRNLILVQNALAYEDLFITNGGVIISHLQKCFPGLVKDRLFLCEKDSLCISSRELEVNHVSSDGSFTRLSNEGIIIWKSRTVERGLRTIMQKNSTVTFSVNDDLITNENDKISLMSHFIRFHSNYSTKRFVNNLSNLNHVGDEIVAVNTPLSCLALYNSWSKGSICNIINEGLAVTDLRLPRQSQGAPVFKHHQNKLTSLVGLVVDTIEYKNKQLTGFSFVAFFPELLSEMITTCNISVPPSDFHEAPYCGRVIKIKAGHRWGTGVIVTEDGIILTSGHVLKYNELPAKKIHVLLGEEKYSVEVLFCTVRDQCYDFAVLSIVLQDTKRPYFTPMSISTRRPEVGESVNAIGYGLFYKAKNPNVTPGIISNVSKYFINTSCFIHSGASGGAITDKSGHLLGLITYNCKNHLTYPFLNFNIAAMSFGKTLQQYVKVKDAAILKNMVDNIQSEILRYGVNKKE